MCSMPTTGPFQSEETVIISKDLDDYYMGNDDKPSFGLWIDQFMVCCQYKIRVRIITAIIEDTGWWAGQITLRI